MKKLRKIPTPQSLANIALHYLGKYAASEASLRRVLTNRIRRAAMDRPELAADPEKQTLLKAEIERIIETHKRTGIINDAAFAEMKIGSLRRQGRSRRAITQKLQVKGLGRQVIETALTQHDEDADPEEVEMKAALSLAKRRKLGPFGKVKPDRELTHKQYATMARAGFSSAIIGKILKAEFPPDEDF